MAPAKEGVGKDPERYKLVERGTIFYNPMRILLGSIALLDEGHEPGITSPDYVVFKSKLEFIHPRWLYYWLRSADGAAFIRTLTRGAVRERMLFRRLAATEIEVPPYESQLDFARAVLFVERARAATEAQLEAAKALPAAYLSAVFNSPDAQQWPTTKLGELGDIVSGITLGRKISEERTRRIPYLRVANVKDGYLDLSDVYQIEATETEIGKLRLKFGDLLLTEGGDPDKLGRGTFWEEQIPECIHQNHIFRVRFDENAISSQFVAAQIGSPYGKAYFLAHAKQTTGIATINQRVLSEFPLMLPPLTVQERIVARLSEQMAGAEKTRKALEEQLSAINALPAALLRRAFNGEL
ncbi:MAG: restriction endonuclease subunit S [Candidatus Rokubacteria bacterium]|nr:restriction endonuclease subunit S [Candidatus Rokubacteria bacterium]